MGLIVFTLLGAADYKIVLTLRMNQGVKVSVTVLAQLDTQVMLVITSTFDIAICIVADTARLRVTAVIVAASLGYQAVHHLQLAVFAFELSDGLR